MSVRISSQASHSTNPVLTLRDISKSYNGIGALIDSNIEVLPGDAIGLIGQNGAGKSTLIKIISGSEAPSSGSIVVEKAIQKFRSSADAQRAGIHTIYQELSLISELTAAENIFLSDLPTKKGLINWSLMRKQASETLKSIGFDIDINIKIKNLTLPERQAVEIAKAIHRNSKVILLDEPTATLPALDVEKLFRVLRKLRNDGVAIIFISHRLDEIWENCNRIMILRDGQQVALAPSDQLHIKEAVKLMVGNSSSFIAQNNLSGSSVEKVNLNKISSSGAPVLEVNSLFAQKVLRDISIEVRPGEIVAVTGLVGSGQNELAAAIFGTLPIQSGEIKLFGKNLEGQSARKKIKAGLGWVPNERKIQGLVLGMTVGANLSLADLSQISKANILQRKLEVPLVKKWVASLEVKASSSDQKVRFLSGGNQQKVVLGKWLIANTKVMLLSEPTRGIDIASKQEIYFKMREYLATGGSILVFSAEVDEALICDRVYVLSHGRVVAELEGDQIERGHLLSLLA
jgi:ABC-type sugar transport system ATPase subunit